VIGRRRRRRALFPRNRWQRKGQGDILNRRSLSPLNRGMHAASTRGLNAASAHFGRCLVACRLTRAGEVIE